MRQITIHDSTRFIEERLRKSLGSATPIDQPLIDALCTHRDTLADNGIMLPPDANGRLDAGIISYLKAWPGQSAAKKEPFIFSLEESYKFRRDVSRAIGADLEGYEVAHELASITIEMTEATPWKADRDKANQAVATIVGGLDFNAGTAQVIRQLSEKYLDDPGLPDKVFKDREWPLPFPLVLKEELREIEFRRNPRVEQPDMHAIDQTANPYGAAATAKLLGLAFSGGGIRSASFNLGVLQRLSEHGLLTNVDYLSTVSGGGYIGTWFSAWVSRRDFRQISNWLSPTKHPDPTNPDLKPIQFLRRFSNYLTPQVGAFSFDTWAMAAVYLRNVILNLAILISGFGALLLLPRLVDVFWRAPQDSNAHGDWALFAGLGILVAEVIILAVHLNRANDVKASPTPSRADGFFGPLWVQGLCVAPLLICSYLLSWWAWSNICRADIYETGLTTWGLWIPVIVFGALSLSLSLVGGVMRSFKERLTWASSWFSIVILPLTAIGVAAVGWGLWHGYLAMLRMFVGMDSGPWHALAWGPPLFLGILSLTAIVQVGLLGVNFPDSGREWFSRLRGVTNIYNIFWLALCSAAIFGPLLFAKLGIWISAIGLGWIATTITSFSVGQSARTGQSKDKEPSVSPLQIIAKIGPPVFVVGFVWAIAIAEYLLLAHSALSSDHFFETLQTMYWTTFATQSPWDGKDWMLVAPAPLAILLAVVAAVLAWRVDINEFSLHNFYKNRLVRCYLGATNPKRAPNPFTGFDERDDIHLSFFKPSKGHTGPYHIINTTLNLSSGQDLAWQERKAASFIFTPSFSGYDLKRTPDHENAPEAGAPAKPTRSSLRSCAYRKTEQYGFPGGIPIGTAMAISGAAADPNQGFNTSPTVAFLMTVFDVRLGWWLGNPRRDDKSKLQSPVFGLAALISELLGSANDSSNFVSLSDGGHFDNMGLYELVRRRCRYIIVCDAEQDPQYQFGGLGMAIRKCRIDFGAEIEIDPSQLVPTVSGHRSGAHCAVGTIHYADDNTGVLLYIKSSLTGDEPEDLMEYSASHRDFPHETTADQWFAESQFESYRKLGYHAVDNALSPASMWVARDAGIAATQAEARTAEIFEALQNYWYPLNKGLRQHAIKHTETLNNIFAQLADTPGLYQLGSKLFPRQNWPPSTQPRDEEKEFYFCMNVIQLVL